MSAEVGCVLVTGASGYIACHVVKQLLRAGHRVRGTVRSLKDETKVKPIRDLVPEAASRLELVEVDLLDEECWDAIVAGCTHVQHIASPLPPSSPKNEDEVIKPAVQGTLSVLKACAKSGTVKRVVLTSSIFAISGGLLPGRFTEDDWPDINRPGMIPYSKSKIVAEKAAWDFVEKLPEEERFELVSINPSIVLGPALSGTLSATMGFIKMMLTNGMPMLPRVTLPIVDVRDVATAHVHAMTKPDVAGKRILIHTDYMWFGDFAQCIHDEFAPQGYRVSVRQAPDFLVRIMRVFIKEMARQTENLGEVTDYDNSRMKTQLGIDPIEVRVSIIDMCYSMIEAGFVEKTAGYKGREQDDSGNK